MCSVAQRSGTVRPPRPWPGRPSPNAAPRTRGRRLCAAVGGGRPTRQPVPAAARRASPRAVPSRGRVGRGSRGLSAAASQPPDVPLLVGALSGAGGSGLVWSVLVFARCLVPRTVVPSLGRVCTEHKRGVQSTARALAPAGRSGGPRAGRGCPRGAAVPGRGCPCLCSGEAAPPPARVGERCCVSAAMPRGASWELLPRSDIFTVSSVARYTC